MAETQVGNILGVTQVGIGIAGTGGAISADAANTVTVTNPQAVRVGASYDIVNATTGAVLASNRQVTSVTSAGVVTYGGADVAAVPGTHILVPTGYAVPVAAASNPYVNINGGSDASHGFDIAPSVTLDTIGNMREYLLSLALPAYTVQRLNSMTYNDLVYACRQQIAPAGIK
jgi:hypothetical protein